MDPDMSFMMLSEFLERFPTPLHHKQPPSDLYLWVFLSKNEGSENNSSSSDSDVGTPLNTIHDKIKSAFSNLIANFEYFIGQFWAPVTINGRKLLSTSGQPFSVSHLSNEFAMYRLDCEKYDYDIDVSNLDIEEGDPKIRSTGGPATAFLNRLLYVDDSESCFGLKSRIMLPVCFPSQTDCIGVLEITSFTYSYYSEWCTLQMMKELKEAGLDVCNVQDRIPYKTINGLRPAKDKITHAIEIVCRSHMLSLAQVWIAVKDKSRVPLSSYSEDTRRIFGLKLIGYLHEDILHVQCTCGLDSYYSLCDVFHSGKRGKEALKTLQDFKPRFFSMLRPNVLLHWDKVDSCGFAICLRSIDTGDFNFAFEFIWPKHSERDILLEAILLTLKRCLPSFKFASGAELDDELDVIDVEYSTDHQTRDFKIFKGKRLSLVPKALEEGKQPIVVDNIEPHEVLPSKDIEKQLDVICVESPIEKTKVKHKTSEIFLTREVIEKQFGNTMNEAKENLKVSLSTLKRKCKVFGISEWPGPNLVKRRANDSCNIQISTNEANGANHDPSTVNISNDIVFIKAEYEDDMIKFDLPISQATFVTVEKRIGMKFKLSVGTFKLKYLDEDGDWILITSDEEMSHCVNSSRKSDRIVVQLRVHADKRAHTGN